MPDNDISIRTKIHRFLKRWSSWNFLFAGFTSKAAIVIPLFGYAIILSDRTVDFFTFDRILNESEKSIELSIQDEKSNTIMLIINSDNFNPKKNDINDNIVNNSKNNKLFVSAPQRMKMMYLGTIIVFLSAIAYNIKRQAPQRISNYRIGYLEIGNRNFSDTEFRKIAIEIKSNFVEKIDKDGRKLLENFNRSQTNETYKTDLLSLNHHLNDKTNRIYLYFCVFFGMLGYIIVLIPSLDVFQAVVRSIFS